MSFIKNIDKSQVLTLKDEVSYQKGQVVSQDSLPRTMP